MITQRQIEVPKEIHKLADQVGQFIQYWGFKKIHGQVWTHVWLAKTPIDATTLAKRLNVSKALISLAIKDLLQYDVIKITSQGDRRKILLIPNHDLHTVITTVLKNRESIMIAEVVKSQAAVDDLEQSTKDSINLDQTQLEQMKMITAMAEMALQTLISNNLKM